MLPATSVVSSTVGASHIIVPCQGNIAAGYGCAPEKALHAWTNASDCGSITIAIELIVLKEDAVH